nr:DNA topoisomerase IV subunit B [Ureaplasma canigenitalium]
MNKYEASDIKILEGLEAVRKRPGMYIGSTSSTGMHHLIWELLDNSIDEVLNGNADYIEVVLNKDMSVSVSDNGRGIPVEENPQSKKSTVETVFTVLHAGGKFDEGAYKTSGGLHGVGASVVNALSSFVDVTVYRNGKIYQCRFENGGKTVKPLTEVGNTRKTGTVVTFRPDKEIFHDISFSPTSIVTRLKESCYLNSGLKIIFTDKVNDQRYEFFSNEGLKDFIKDINSDYTTTVEPIYFEGTDSGINVEVSLSYTNREDDMIVSFANSVKTNEGGVHVNAFKTALSNIVNNFGRTYQLLKEREKNLEGDDIREGLSCVISVKVPERLISYEGQTKNKLYTPEAFTAVKNVVEQQLNYFLSENKSIAITMINRAIEARNVRNLMRKAKEETKKTKKIKEERFMGGKLTPAQSKDPTMNELFIVEGDSAGGSAKLGRDKKHQAILPLRGKVMNVLKQRLVDVLKNEEISSLFYVLGTGIGNDFDIKKLKYHKIIIMTDADTDGSHIQVLLITLFYKFLKPLIENNHLFIALPPLYKFTNLNTKKHYYCFDEYELSEMKKNCKNFEIQRYKGLGEMNADQLYETTMRKENRILLQVKIEDALQAEKQINTLMGDDVALRKKWIDQNIDFSVVDEIINTGVKEDEQ